MTPFQRRAQKMAAVRAARPVDETAARERALMVRWEHLQCTSRYMGNALRRAGFVRRSFEGADPVFCESWSRRWGWKEDRVVIAMGCERRRGVEVRLCVVAPALPQYAMARHLTNPEITGIEFFTLAASRRRARRRRTGVHHWNSPARRARSDILRTIAWFDTLRTPQQCLARMESGPVRQSSTARAYLLAYLMYLPPHLDTWASPHAIPRDDLYYG